MTFLFVRFYLGVLGLLAAAWIIQFYVIFVLPQERNVPVIESALRGGVLSARDALVAADPERVEETLAAIRRRFDYPVTLVPRSERPMTPEMLARIEGDVVQLYDDGVLAAMPDSALYLEMGPLPQFIGPSRREVLLGLGSVLGLAAAAIAVLLRPIANQFRVTERAATEIAGGDLGWRITPRRLGRRLPLTTAFNAMADRLEMLVRSQTELFQAVSHELRTPLARIRFASELLRPDATEPRTRGRIDSIDDAVDQLDGLVGELLTYVRADADLAGPEPDRIDIDEVVRQCLDQHAAIRPAIDFGVNTTEPTVILGHRPGITRAIGNGIGNAAKYAGTRVAIAIRQDADGVLVIIDDDGPGIPPEQRESVFEPFQRFDDGGHTGSGLGLAITRRVARRHGGDATITESPTGGTRLTIGLGASAIV